jgi:hypothetical protein
LYAELDLALQEVRQESLMRRISQPTLQFGATKDNHSVIGIAAEDPANGLRQSDRRSTDTSVRKIQTLIDESLDCERTHWNAVQYENTTRITRKVDAVVPSGHHHFCGRGRGFEPLDTSLTSASIVQICNVRPHICLRLGRRNYARFVRSHHMLRPLPLFFVG